VRSVVQVYLGPPSFARTVRPRGFGWQATTVRKAEDALRSSELSGGMVPARSVAGRVGWLRLPSGGVAQLGERLVCNQEAIGSIPFTSTILRSKSEGCTVFELRMASHPSLLRVKDARSSSFGWQAILHCFE
jgi:hypothetical protein